MTAFNVYNGDGSQTQFPITFDYFNVSEIEVLLWDSAVSKWLQKTNTVDYNIASTNINFVAAPAAPPSGITGNVLILRKTEVGTTTLTDAQAVYSPGSAINAADLNKNQIQALRAVLDLRDSNMPIHGKTWADSSQETRLYSDLNMTGREIKNVSKIKFESFAFTEGGIEVETDTKDIPTQAELALKDDIASVDSKLALNVTNEDAKLALKDDITSVNTKLALNVTNEDAKLALKDDISSVNAKLALNVTNEDAKLATKADLVAGKVPASQIPNIAITDFKGNVANQTAMLAVTGEKGDWVSRSDEGKVYVITGTDPSLIGSWTALSYPVTEIDPNTVIDANYVATDENFTTADHAKLDGIQAGAEVNTVTSVNGSTGAVTVQGFSGNYSDLTGKPTLGTAAATDSTAYATSTQGAKADSAVQPIDLSVVASSGDYSDLTNKPNLALKADLVGSVLDTSQLPELAITKFCGVVANENDMLALGIPGLPGGPGGGGELGPPPGPGFIPEYGDWCIRSDNDKVYIVTGPDATLASDWTAISYPDAPVTSVAGRTGVVTLSTSDISGLGTAATTASTDYATAAQGTKADSATQPGDLATVATTGAYNDLSGKPTLGTAAATASTDYATAAQGTLANSATQPADLAVVQADVDQNEADADTAIAAVQADVDQNEADSDAAELALSNRLNTLEADPTTATAVAAVQADVDLNEANLATVATSGSYNDLSGKPTIPTIDPDTVIDANYVATDNNFTNADHTKLAGIAAGAEVNVVTSVASKTGAVTLVKGDVGLGNVDNTADANKPVSTATQTALNAKADLVAGKLNTSQLPDIAIAEYKGNVTNQTAMLAITGEKGDWVIRNDDSKVYVITGTNPSVASDWTALSYPSAGFSGAYSDLSGKPTLGTAAATASTDYATAAQGSLADSATQPGDLHAVATSGAYNDLSGKPTLGTAAATASTDYATAAQGTLADSATQPGDLATVATSGSYNDLSGKPTIPSNNNQLTNGAGYVTSNTQLSNEQVQDLVGGMVSGNSESGITVTYQDSDGTLDFSVASQTDQNFTNADHTKLNGIETGATADQSAAEILTSIKTVDGSGSGLDADLLDGQQGSYYSNYNNLSNKPTIPTNNNQLTNGAGYITSANGGNATYLNGRSWSESAVANTIVSRSGSGDTFQRYSYFQWCQARTAINDTSGGSGFVMCSTDGWYRHYSAANARSVMGLAFASQAEAQAGSDNSKIMTPLRVAQAITALGGGGSVINSIQRGTFQVGSYTAGYYGSLGPTNQGPTNVSITSVNTAKTMVNYCGSTNEDGAYLSLSSATNLQGYRGIGYRGQVQASYEIIEFN